MENKKWPAKPLSAAMEKHLKKSELRLHMPGHKGKKPKTGATAKWGELFSYDLTETGQLDNLNAPTGAILAAEAKMAKLYNSKAAYFLVNGATVGLQAAILASCRPGDKIILPRNAHRSIWSAVAIAGAVPVWLPVFLHPRYGIPLAIPEQVAIKAIEENNDARAMVFTYPSYHGLCGDLKKSARKAAEAGIFTIVDQAHGAHFRFVGWPDPAEDSGAAVVVCSWHKTMGSLNQTAVCLQNDFSYPVAKYLAMLQTSSPSYPLMVSLDECRHLWETKGELLAAGLLKNANAVRQGLAKNPVLDALDSRNLPWPVQDFDTSRIVIESEMGHNGWQIEKALLAAGIRPEMVDSGTVTLILSAFDSPRDIQKLVRLLYTAGQQLEKITPKPFSFVDFGALPEMAVLPGEALKRETELVPLAAAAGRIAAELLVPYPPGIPVAGPGELLSEAIIAGLLYIMDEGGPVQGVRQGQIEVLK